MKTEQLLIRLSPEELMTVNDAFKVELLASNGLLTRSEFIRAKLIAACASNPGAPTKKEGE